MGPGKQEVYFSEHCIQEGVSISRVLQALIGDDSSTHQIAESDSGSPSAQQNQPQQTDDAGTQGCASELISH